MRDNGLTWRDLAALTTRRVLLPAVRRAGIKTIRHKAPPVGAIIVTTDAPPGRIIRVQPDQRSPA